MDDEDYLFPRDLRVSESGIARVLMIGSCQTAQIHTVLRRAYPQTTFDYLVTNYVGDLAGIDAAGSDPYDLVFIQFPLRSIITDHIVWASRLDDEGFCRQVLATARETLSAMLEGAVAHAASRGAHTFVANFMVPQQPAALALEDRDTIADPAHVVVRINACLHELVAARDDCAVLDVDRIAAAIGKRYVLDDDIYFLGHNALKQADWSALEPDVRRVPPMSAFYPSKAVTFARLIYARMEHDYRAHRQIDPVKAVVFDLDHTLWRGQIAEDYRDDQESWPTSDTWPIGLWEAVHHLKARGILVSLCSKNDHAVVEANWHKALAPAFLRLDDFVAPKINWLPKPDNIAALLEAFGLTPKSMVFVDDNPVERAAVRAAFPDMRVIGDNPYLTRRILLWSAETQVRSVTRESQRREAMVRGQITREGARATLDRADFLAGLGSRLTFLSGDALAGERVRVLELINKTNQFNTNGRRWDARAIAAFQEAGGEILAFRVTDRFADYGLVGVILVEANRIEQFVMSCRVMGMELELAAIAHVATAMRDRLGPLPLHASVRPTADNMPCRAVFERAGFAPIGEHEGGLVYALAPAAEPTMVPHVDVSDAGVRALHAEPAPT